MKNYKNPHQKAFTNFEVNIKQQLENSNLKIAKLTRTGSLQFELYLLDEECYYGYYTLKFPDTDDARGMQSMFEYDKEYYFKRDY